MKKTIVTSKRAEYSTKTKYEAVVLHRMIGNMSTVSKHLGVPVETLYNWNKQDWWFEIEEEIRKEGKAKLSSSLQKIVDRALVEVQDRLENGDWIYDQKAGEMKRKPIGAHTVNQILKDGLDKQFLMEKLVREEKVVENSEKVTERLMKLAAEFERYTKAKEITAEGLPLDDISKEMTKSPT